MTIAHPPLSTMLDRLFTEADAAWAQRPQAAQTRPRQPRTADREDYLATYTRMKDQPLPVSPETGRLLYMLARSIGARTIVEFGTSFAISTIHLAAALRDNGGGKLIGTEFEPSKIARARRHLAEAGLADIVELREGDALETLARDLPDSIDLVLLDGAKSLYPAVLTLLEPHLRTGALIVADNSDSSPDYVARVRDPAQGYISVPFADDVEVSMRMGQAG
jgi:predicted O-methyltransferase YrrM